MTDRTASQTDFVVSTEPGLDLATAERSTSWSPSGSHRLYRRRFLPRGAVDRRLLILHGYGDHSGRFLHVMDWFAAQGAACDAFDFRGHGRSSGRRGYVRRWDEFLEDLRVMLATVRDDAARSGVADRPLFILGHSHGGLVAAAAGVDGVLQSAGVAGVVLSAPYLRPAEALSPLWRTIAMVTSTIAPALRVSSGLSAEMMTCDPAMIEDSRKDPLLLRSATPRWYRSTLATQERVMSRAADFGLPLLCLIGDADRIADPAAAEAFVQNASSHSKRFTLLPGQKHEILRETDRLATFDNIHRWFQGQE